MFFSQLGDRVGRVRALGVSVVLYSLSTAGMALVDGIGALFALRFLAGIGTGGEWSLGFAMVAEAWPRAGRGARGGLVTAMFNLGTFLAIGLYQSGLSWRGAFAVMLAPALGVIWLRAHVPEPQAFRDLQAARAAGRIDDPAVRAALERPPLRAVFAAPLGRITFLTTALFAFLNFAFYSFATLFMQFLQSPTGSGGLGLSKSEELPYQLALNITALVGVMGAGALSDRLGRKPVFAACAGLGLLGFGALWAVVDAASPDGGVPGGLFPAFAVCCLAFGVNGVLGAWTPELYPTHLRTTGPGFAQNLGKGIGGMLGPVLAGKLLPSAGYAVVLGLPGLFFLVAALFAWRLPRVDGRALAGVESTDYLGT
jgi:MFS family permease